MIKFRTLKPMQARSSMLRSPKPHTHTIAQPSSTPPHQQCMQRSIEQNLSDPHRHPSHSADRSQTPKRDKDHHHSPWMEGQHSPLAQKGPNQRVQGFTLEHRGQTSSARLASVAFVKNSEEVVYYRIDSMTIGIVSILL